MTLVTARDKTIQAIETELSPRRPVVKVTEYEGAFSIKEVRKLYTTTPRILVSPLASGKKGINLAAYLLMKSTDKGLLEIIDAVKHAIRHLPGPGRPVLDVSARSLYDKDAGEMGARLWGFSALWPHLSTGDISGESGGPIAQEVQNQKGKINGVLPGLQIGGTEAERSELVAESEPPFILIIPQPGGFSTKQAGPTKYSDGQNKLWSRKVSGAFEIPMEIQCWGRDEAEAESLCTTILPLLAYSDTEAGLNKKVQVEKAGPTNDESGAAVFSIDLKYTAQIGGIPEIVPVFKSASADPE